MSDKDIEAVMLAQKHYAIEPGITEIFRILSTHADELETSEPIKLLEVNSNTIASGIMPLGFAAAPNVGVHFPSIIIEVTPDEYQQILSGELGLREGWRLLDTPVPRGANGSP